MIRKFNNKDYENVNGGIKKIKVNEHGGYSLELDGINDFNTLMSGFKALVNEITSNEYSKIVKPIQKDLNEARTMGFSFPLELTLNEKGLYMCMKAFGLISPSLANSYISSP